LYTNCSVINLTGLEELNNNPRISKSATDVQEVEEELSEYFISSNENNIFSI
jgi:hypothetical protein